MGKSILIKDTTREECVRIIRGSLDCGAGGCENCSSCWRGGGTVDGIYQDYADYIEGRCDFREITVEIRNSNY